MYLPSVLIGYLEAGEGKGADERARGPPTYSLRVIHHALQGFARGCKPRISRRLSSLPLAVCCTVLRSRWYQSGIKMLFFLVVRSALGVTQSTFLHLSQIVHRNVQARGA
jgi:hypothetical protein